MLYNFSKHLKSLRMKKINCLGPEIKNILFKLSKYFNSTLPDFKFPSFLVGIQWSHSFYFIFLLNYILEEERRGENPKHRNSN